MLFGKLGSALESFGFFLLTAALGGCSTDSDAARGAGDLPLEQFLASRSEALCRWSQGCGLLPDAASCNEVGLFDWRWLEADVAAGIIRYDATLARECLEYENSEAYLSCAFDDPGWELACRDVLVGTIEDGDACYGSGQCVPGAICDNFSCEPDASCCLGTCVTRAPAGSPCGAGWLCDEHSYCDEGVCRTAPTVGDDCTDSGKCGSGSVCHMGDADEKAVCVAPAGLGKPCEPEAWNCSDWDAWCNPATKTCERAADVGQPCSGDDGCLLHAYCDGSSCRPLSSVGESCAEGYCLIHLTCSDGTCSATEPCTLP